MSSFLGNKNLINAGPLLIDCFENIYIDIWKT